MIKNAIRKITPEQAYAVIDTRLPLGLFYVLESDTYIGIDNSNGQAWTEEFPNLRMCKHWLRHPNIQSMNKTVITGSAQLTAVRSLF